MGSGQSHARWAAPVLILQLTYRQADSSASFAHKAQEMEAQESEDTCVSWALPSPSLTSLTCSRSALTRFFRIDSWLFVNLSILAICISNHAYALFQDQ